MDAPIHCISNAASIADIPLEDLISPGIVIDVSGKADESYSLGVNDIEGFEEKYGKISEGVFVIVYTGWSRHWLSPDAYRNKYHFPSVSKEAAQLLLGRRVKGLGVDTLSPDRPESGYPGHRLFLEAGKYIIEKNVANAHHLPATGFQVFALPLKVAGAAEAPVRLIATLPELL